MVFARSWKGTVSGRGQGRSGGCIGIRIRGSYVHVRLLVLKPKGASARRAISIGELGPSATREPETGGNRGRSASPHSNTRRVIRGRTGVGPRSYRACFSVCPMGNTAGHRPPMVVIDAGAVGGGPAGIGEPPAVGTSRRKQREGHRARGTPRRAADERRTPKTGCRGRRGYLELDTARSGHVARDYNGRPVRGFAERDLVVADGTTKETWAVRWKCEDGPARTGDKIRPALRSFSTRRAAAATRRT